MIRTILVGAAALELASFSPRHAPRLRGARYTQRTNRVRGAASIVRSKSATPTRWQSVASAITTRTTSLDPRSKGRPGNVALARTNFRPKSAHSSRALK